MHPKYFQARCRLSQHHPKNQLSLRSLDACMMQVSQSNQRRGELAWSLVRLLAGPFAQPELFHFQL